MVRSILSVLVGYFVMALVVILSFVPAIAAPGVRVSSRYCRGIAGFCRLQPFDEWRRSNDWGPRRRRHRRQG